MRLAISSTACNGKSFLIESFLANWPMYKTPEKTYRDLYEEKGLSLNKKGNLESQRIIRDSLVDQAIENAGEDFCIHDRCVLDNLAYTLWLAEKGKIDDDEFVADSFNITRETLKMYDIVFFLPIHPRSPVTIEDSEGRDTDLEFRAEINNIFLGIQEMYSEHNGLVFPLEDSPALIELYGDEQQGEKTQMIADYLDVTGELKTTDESLIKTLSETAQENALASALIEQVSNP